ncbi:MAG: response regulator, partial [Candidatus Eisenbacteria bacterium]|nr:response regulator [Candidatus Eisenbacteria bacterium]
DLIVLSVRLRQRSGLLVCQTIRAHPRTWDLPIILVSEKGEMDNRVQGLRMGADDYISKPFFPRELILRIQKILQRVSRQKELEIRVQKLEQELAEAHTNGYEARKSVQRLRRHIVDEMVHLAHAFHAGGMDGLNEALSQMISQRWGDGPFVYLQRASDGFFRPILSRGIPPRNLLDLVIPASLSGLEGDGLSQSVLLDNVSIGSPLAAIKYPFAASGLRILVPGHLFGETVGVLAIGETANGRLPSGDDLTLAQGAILIFHSLWHRGRVEGQELHHFGWRAARWVEALEEADPSTRGHSRAVSRLCAHLAERLGLEDPEIERIRLAGALHRFAKPPDPTGIYTESCQGIAPLDMEDVEPTVGFGNIDEPHENSLTSILRHQSEAWNGGGRPLGLARGSIPLGSRILAVAEAYIWRCRGEFDRSEAALGSLREEAGVWFDPKIVEHLAQLVHKSEDTPAMRFLEMDG